jgi:hypothetical protein
VIIHICIQLRTGIVLNIIILYIYINTYICINIVFIMSIVFTPIGLVVVL